MMLFAKASQQIMAVPLMSDLIIAWHNGNMWFNRGLHGRCWRRVATKNTQQKPMEAVLTQLHNIIIGNKSPSRIHFPPVTNSPKPLGVPRGGNMLSSHLHLVRQSDVEQFKVEGALAQKGTWKVSSYSKILPASGLVEQEDLFFFVDDFHWILLRLTGGWRTQFQV